MWWRTRAATLDVSIVVQQAATLWESGEVLFPRVRRTTRSIHHISSLIAFLAVFLFSFFSRLHFLSFSFLRSFRSVICSRVSFSTFLWDCCFSTLSSVAGSFIGEIEFVHELHFSNERHAREGGDVCWGVWGVFFFFLIGLDVGERQFSTLATACCGRSA